MKIVALKTFTYAGNRIAIGDEVETKTDRDAKLLVGIRSARYVEQRTEAKIPAPKPTLLEKVNAPKPEVKPEVKPEADEPKPETETETEVKPEVETEAEIETDEPHKVEAEPKPEAVKVNENKRSYSRKK